MSLTTNSFLAFLLTFFLTGVYAATDIVYCENIVSQAYTVSFCGHVYSGTAIFPGDLGYAALNDDFSVVTSIWTNPYISLTSSLVVSSTSVYQAAFFAGSATCLGKFMICRPTKSLLSATTTYFTLYAPTGDIATLTNVVLTTLTATVTETATETETQVALSVLLGTVTETSTHLVVGTVTETSTSVLMGTSTTTYVSTETETSTEFSTDTVTSVSVLLSTVTKTDTTTKVGTTTQIDTTTEIGTTTNNLTHIDTTTVIQKFTQIDTITVTNNLTEIDTFTVTNVLTVSLDGQTFNETVTNTVLETVTVTKESCSVPDMETITTTEIVTSTETINDATTITTSITYGSGSDGVLTIYTEGPVPGTSTMYTCFD